MSARPVAADEPTAARPADARWRAVLASVALGVLAYLGFSVWAGWHDVAASAARAGAGGVALLLALSAANYALRFVRWQLYLRALGARIGWRRSGEVYLAGFALTTTPGKAGEAVRSVFLRHHGVGMTASLAAFFSERLSDLVAIVALAALGVASHPSLRPLVLAALVACVALLLLLAARNALARWQARAAGSPRRALRLLQPVLAIAVAATRCHRPGVLLAASALSLVAWACEAWGFHLLLGWLGIAEPWHFAFFVYAAGMLAGALSFLPGGLGGTEAVMVALLLWAGHGQADAIAATVLIRLCTLWFAVALGAAALPLAARAAAGTRAVPAPGMAPRGSA